jgi:hypothetical protein
MQLFAPLVRDPERDVRVAAAMSLATPRATPTRPLLRPRDPR